MTTLIDTHCHYNLSPLLEDWRTYWQAAQAAGLTGSVLVGTDLESSLAAAQLAQENERFVLAVGIHPTSAADDASFDESATSEATILSLIAAAEKKHAVQALGEIGLDYYHLPDNPQLRQRAIARQKRAFSVHLKLAAQRALPVIIHVRDRTDAAYQATLDILTEWRAGTAAPHSGAGQVPVILHCFSGPEWYRHAAIELGCYFGFAGNVTYPSAGNLREHFRAVPPDRRLLETDAPYLPPQPFRGQTCAPAQIAETARYLESELNAELSQLATNARRVFPTLSL